MAAFCNGSSRHIALRRTPQMNGLSSGRLPFDSSGQMVEKLSRRWPNSSPSAIWIFAVSEWFEWGMKLKKTKFAHSQIVRHYLDLLSKKEKPHLAILALIAFTGIYAHRLAELEIAQEDYGQPDWRDYRRDIYQVSIYASRILLTQLDGKWVGHLNIFNKRPQKSKKSKFKKIKLFIFRRIFAQSSLTELQANTHGEFRSVNFSVFSSAFHLLQLPFFSGSLDS